MPTQRCEAERAPGERCPGVFAYSFDERPNHAILHCPLCGAANRWVASMEEWLVDSERPAAD